MAKYTVTYTSEEEVEVDADSAEEAIEIAKNIGQGDWTLVNNDWDAYCNSAEAESDEG